MTVLGSAWPDAAVLEEAVPLGAQESAQAEEELASWSMAAAEAVAVSSVLASRPMEDYCSPLGQEKNSPAGMAQDLVQHCSPMGQDMRTTSGMIQALDQCCSPLGQGWSSTSRMFQELDHCCSPMGQD